LQHRRKRHDLGKSPLQKAPSRGGSLSESLSNSPDRRLARPGAIEPASGASGQGAALGRQGLGATYGMGRPGAFPIHHSPKKPLSFNERLRAFHHSKPLIFQESVRTAPTGSARFEVFQAGTNAEVNGEHQS
jgi:hypothetical protein